MHPHPCPLPGGEGEMLALCPVVCSSFSPDPDGEHHRADDRCDQGGNDELREIRQHA